MQGRIGRQQNYGQIFHQPQFAKGIFPPEIMAALALSKYKQILPQMSGLLCFKKQSSTSRKN